MNATSAAMSVQARYAPSTDTITPALMNHSPHWPTVSSKSPTIEGCRVPAISDWGNEPYDTIVTSEKIARTLRKPSTVAWPTCSRRWAWRE